LNQVTAKNFLSLIKDMPVEWKRLGNEKYFQVANSGRKPVKASLRIPGKTPYYGANNIQDYVEGYTHDGEFVLVAEDGSASLEKYSIQYAKGKFWANNHVHVIRGISNVDTRYLFHYLTTFNFVPYLTGGGRAKLTRARLVEIPIPIPPLPIQHELVRILDTFTTLTAELTAELTGEFIARKKQYNYYRDHLLTFDGWQPSFHAERSGVAESIEQGAGSCDFAQDDKKRTVEWVTLDKIYKFQYGTGNKIPTVGGKYPVYGSNGIVGMHNEYNSEDAPVIGHIGAYAGIVNWANGKHFVTYNGVICKKINPKVNSKYAYYILLAQNFMNKANKASQPFISYSTLNKTLVPIPTLSVQEKIVAILNKFDVLTNSISEGLPREIELRQKQYEYYREQLLNFPKPGAMAG